MQEQTASIGRIVHYVAVDGTHLPAIIVVNRDTPHSKEKGIVALAVFNDPLHAHQLGELSFVHHDQTAPVFTWHWPEREA